jgi:hypothetical protein
MKTKQRTNKFLQTQLFFPKNQLEKFLYHLQKMDVDEMYAALGSKLTLKENKIEQVFLELIGFIDCEKEFFDTQYLILKRGTCGSGICPNAGKQGYHLLSGNTESENTFSFLVHHENGEIKNMDLCWDMICEGEKIDGKKRMKKEQETLEILEKLEK